MWNLIYVPIIVKNKITSKKVTCGFVPMRVNDFVLKNNRDWSGFSLEWKDCEGTKKNYHSIFSGSIVQVFKVCC